MFFKQIDRYISRRFLLFFFGGLILLGFLYGSFDVIKKIEDVQQVGIRERLALLATYYAYVLPIFLLDVVPAMVLVAAGLAVVEMAKTRELLVLKASGISVYRTLAPVLALTVLISVGTFAAQQSLGPLLNRQTKVLDRQLEDKVAKQLLLVDPAYQRRFFVGEYDYGEGRMTNVSVIEFAGQIPRRVHRTLLADEGIFQDDGAIVLKTVTVQQYDDTGSPVRSEEDTLVAEVRLETTLTVVDFIRAAEENVQQGSLLQTLSDVYEMMKANPRVTEFKVVFHSRLASLFTPIILLLVGLPCLVGFEHSVRSRFLGVIVSIVVAAGFYALNFVFSSMGAAGTVNPALAGWLPSIIGGSVGLWLFESMAT